MRAEYHFRNAAGLPRYYAGELTTDHAASSRGLPVFVIDGAGYTDLPLRGVIGPGELPPIGGHDRGGLCAVGARTPDGIAMLRAAAAAGYPVEADQVTPQTVDDLVV